MCSRISNLVLAALCLCVVLVPVAADENTADKAKAHNCAVANVEKGMWCATCKALVDPAALKEGKCATCNNAPAECEVCVVKSFHCDACKLDADGAKCGKCSGELKEMTDKCRVSWECPKCGADADKPGKCANGDCKEAEMAKSCEKSGTSPHVAKGNAEHPKGEHPKGEHPKKGEDPKK